jgi:hypothetical protein
MAGDNTPGNLRRVPCPRCAASVFFTAEGGPKQLLCFSCKSNFDLDVVHDGKKWTVRRVRGGGPISL